MLTIRHAEPRDVEALRELYGYHLVDVRHDEPRSAKLVMADDAPTASTTIHRHLPLEKPLSEWCALLDELIDEPNYHLLVGNLDDRVVASVTLVVVRNLTHGLRPYALIENVVTHSDFRKNGYAAALMAHACELARKCDCYKVMLMTGSKKDSTLRFYESCGFSRHEKTAFVMRL